MSVAQQQALILGSICLAAALVLTVVLALTRASRFGVFALVNFLLGAALFGAQAFFGFAGWRSEVLAASVIELPAVFLISWVCLAQVGGLSGGTNTSPSEPVIRRPRLRKVLGWAPVALLVAWAIAVMVGFAWPSAAMQPYAPAPVQFLLFKWPMSISQTAFAGLAAAVFAMAALSRASTPILRLRNAAFSVSVASLALVGVETTLTAGVRYFVGGQRRREIIDSLLVFETVLAVVCFATLILGLALRYTPVVAAAVLRQVHTGWLPARERLESSGWQAMAGGRTRGVSRVTYRLEEAAKLAGISQPDADRAVAAVQLIAVMQDPSSEKGGITLEAARELYEMENEIAQDEVLGPKLQASLQRRSDAVGSGSPYGASLQDALKAALDLTDTQECDPDEAPRPMWFQLVAVASADAGLIDEEHAERQLGGEQMDECVAAAAYRAAKGRLRSQVFRRP